MSASWSYGIIFSAENYVSPVATEVTTALQGVQQSTMNISWGAEQMGTTSLRGFRNLMFGAQMGVFYMSMLEGGMLRTESASIAVDMAEQRLTDTIAKYGANSAEATRATQQLERSQLFLQRAGMYTSMMYVSMGLQVGSMAMNVYSAIPSLLTLGTTLHTVAAGFTTLWAAMGPVGWAILGIGAAAAIGAGVYFATRPSVEVPDTLNINLQTNVNDAVDAYAARLKRAIATAG
jgi:hypothetical protein